MENCCIKKEEPRRCKRCVMPETKGRVDIDENGLCNVNVNIKMYKKWKIKMYNLGSTIHQLSYHQ